MAALLVAVVAFGGAVTLALHHPVAPALALVVLCGWTIALVAAGDRWPAWLLAVLPLVGFASWTGSIMVEEADILALGAAAGGYSGIAWRALRVRSAGASGWSGAATWLWAAFAVWGGVALARAFAHAGGLDPGLAQSYDGAQNGLRVLKPLLLTLLLAPLLVIAIGRLVERSSHAFAVGMASAAALTGLCVLWERAAFPGVLNFSSDYRATGPFWEMHVGGAALDGMLALGLPFAVALLLRARTPLRIALAGVAVLLASYACLATFSRGLYLAVPVSLGILVLLRHASMRAASAGAVARTALRAALGVALAVALALLTFTPGGYRALAAALAVFALSLPLAALGALTVRDAAVALVVGVAGGWISDAALSMWIAKSAYWTFALACAVAIVLLGAGLARKSARARIGAWSAFAWTALAAWRVADTWAGAPAAWHVAVVVGVIFVLTAWRSRRGADATVVPWRTYAGTLAAAVGVSAVVVVFTGGAYMSNRFSNGETDLGGRMKHWSDGLSMLRTPTDWLLGRGLGRFPAEYFFNVPDGAFPGSYRLGLDRDGEPFLTLSGPRAAAGFNELFRISQRVRPIPGSYVLQLDALSTEPVRLHTEICEKHLLYPQHCAVAAVDLPARAGWQPVRLALDARRLEPGTWYAPRLGFMSIAVDAPGRKLDITHVTLTRGEAGGNLVANGDFERGMAHWFFTSDRYHLPWHIKSLPLAVLFDEGAVGLVLFVVLVAVALARLIAGRARRHPLAPCIAAALLGFLLVGAFDSLIDVPRLALAFYLTLVVAFALPATDTGS